MTDIPLSDLRAVDEDTIVRALENSPVADTLHGIAPVVLLEMFQAVVDEIAGEGE